MTAMLLRLSSSKSHRRPQISFAIGKRKAGWHNANDCVAGRAQGYRLTYYVGIVPKAAFPETLAYDGDILVSRFVFLISKCAAQHRPHTKHFEDSRSYSGAAEPLRFGVIGNEVVRGAAYGRKRFKGRILFLPIQEVPR